MAEPLLRFQTLGERTRAAGNAHPVFAPQGTYPTAGDDRWIAITVRDDHDWQALVVAMGSPAWARAEELARAGGRRARRAEIDGHIADWTRAQERDAVASALQEASVPAAPVLDLAEMLRHPHFIERRLAGQVRDAVEGREWAVYRTPWTLGRTPGAAESAAPALGADNDYVFGELLGLSRDERERLADDGVIR
jgi:benzylsuccinate CoA-transferase BbsF subunit